MCQEDETPVRDHDTSNGRDNPDGNGKLERIVGGIVLLCVAVLAIQFGIWTYRRFAPARPAAVLGNGHFDVGSDFPRVGVSDLSGYPLELVPAEPGMPATVLVILTTKCPFCRINIPIWNEVRGALGDQVRFVGLCLDDLEETKRFVDSARPGFPILVVEEPRSFVAELGIQAVPQTLALDSDGVIQQIWGGGLNEDQIAPILQFLETLVPGLQDALPRRGDPEEGH
jgi:hypothetical protein